MPPASPWPLAPSSLSKVLVAQDMQATSEGAVAGAEWLATSGPELGLATSQLALASLCLAEPGTRGGEAGVTRADGFTSVSSKGALALILQSWELACEASGAGPTRTGATGEPGFIAIVSGDGLTGAGDVLVSLPGTTSIHRGFCGCGEPGQFGTDPGIIIGETCCTCPCTQRCINMACRLGWSGGGGPGWVPGGCGAPGWRTCFICDTGSAGCVLALRGAAGPAGTKTRGWSMAAKAHVYKP